MAYESDGPNSGEGFILPCYSQLCLERKRLEESLGYYIVIMEL